MQESGLSDIIPLICNQLSETSILCYILSFLRAHHRVWLQSDGYYMAGIPSFLSSLKAHQLTIHGGCNRWWLWHPLFTVNGRKCSIFQVFGICLLAVSSHGLSLVPSVGDREEASPVRSLFIKVQIPSWGLHSNEGSTSKLNLRASGEGGDRGWDGWMASSTQWTWVWANSRR